MQHLFFIYGTTPLFILQNIIMMQFYLLLFFAHAINRAIHENEYKC